MMIVLIINMALHTMMFISLVQNIDMATIETNDYSMIKDNIYIHNFEIDCDTDQVRWLFEVWHLTK